VSTLALKTTKKTELPTLKPQTTAHSLGQVSVSTSGSENMSAKGLAGHVHLFAQCRQCLAVVGVQLVQQPPSPWVSQCLEYFVDVQNVSHEAAGDAGVFSTMSLPPIDWFVAELYAGIYLHVNPLQGAFTVHLK
jgi:hypothetical protein